MGRVSTLLGTSLSAYELRIGTVLGHRGARMMRMFFNVILDQRMPSVTSTQVAVSQQGLTI